MCVVYNTLTLIFRTNKDLEKSMWEIKERIKYCNTFADVGP